MKYINAASKYDEATMHVKGSLVIILLMLLGANLFIILYSAFNYNTLVQFRNALPVYITAFVITSIFIIILRSYFGLIREYNVEINDEGVYHKSPGREIRFKWEELSSLKEDLSWYWIPTLEVYWENNRYRFNPLLITEAQSQNQKLNHVNRYGKYYRASFAGLFSTAWKFNDGSYKALDLENSQGYLLIKKYRPDMF